MNGLIFVVLAATFSWNQPSVELVLSPREQRTREMRRALHVDEAEREARRYELRKRKLNEAADMIASISDPSNTVSMVRVDLKNRVIITVYENGRTAMQTYTPSQKAKRKEKRQPPKYDGEAPFQDKEYNAEGWHYIPWKKEEDCVHEEH